MNMKVLMTALIAFHLIFSGHAAEAKSKAFPFIGVWKQSENDDKMPGHRVEFTKNITGFIEYHDMEKTRFSYRMSGQQAIFNIKEYWTGHEATDERHTNYLTFTVTPQNNGSRLILKMSKGLRIYSTSKKREILPPLTITLYSVWHTSKSKTKQASSNKRPVNNLIGTWTPVNSKNGDIIEFQSDKGKKLGAIWYNHWLSVVRKGNDIVLTTTNDRGKPDFSPKTYYGSLRDNGKRLVLDGVSYYRLPR